MRYSLLPFILLISLPSSLWAVNLYVAQPNHKMIAKVTPSAQSSLITLLDAQNLKPIARFETPGLSAQNIEFSPSGTNRLLVSSDSRLMSFDLSDPKAPKLSLDLSTDGEPPLRNPHFAPDSNEIYWSQGRKLYRSGRPGQKKQSVGEAQGIIEDLTPLKNRQVAASQKGSDQLILFSAGSQTSIIRINGHQSELVGVESVDGSHLYSLDKNQRLIDWNLLDLKPQHSYQLKTSGSTPVRLAADDLRKKLYVVVNKEGKEEVFGYPLFDLQSNHIRPHPETLTTTPSGSLYSGKIPFTPYPHQRKSQYTDQKNPVSGPYDWAKIEADNHNYPGALNYIAQVLPQDRNYRKSRELRQSIFGKIEQQQGLNSAKEQYRTGNYHSAEILLQEVLAKNPAFKEAKRYLDLTQSKRFGKKLSQFVIFLIALLALAGLAFLVWRRQSKKVKGDGNFFFKHTDPGQKRRLILLVKKVEQLLALRKEQDKMGYYHNKLTEIESQLTWIKKQMRKDGVSYSELYELTAQFHQEMLAFAKTKPNTAGNSTQSTSHTYKETSKTRTNERKQKTSTTGNSTKQGDTKASNQQNRTGPTAPPADEPPDWYALLGVKTNATTAQIKSAYREKIKEYHPDKHNSSDFDWVKEEAERITRLVGQAYECLQNPISRRSYDQTRKRST